MSPKNYLCDVTNFVVFCSYFYGNVASNEPWLSVGQVANYVACCIVVFLFHSFIDGAERDSPLLKTFTYAYANKKFLSNGRHHVNVNQV